MMHHYRNVKDRIAQARAVVIGNIPDKDNLLDQVRAVRNFGPYVASMFWHEQFTMIPGQQVVKQTEFCPSQQGFTAAPTRTEFFDPQRLAEWSKANLDGYVIELNPPEVGAHMAREPNQLKGVPILIAMDPIPASDGRQGVFEITEDFTGELLLNGRWMRPDFLIGLDESFSFLLRPM